VDKEVRVQRGERLIGGDQGLKGKGERNCGRRGKRCNGGEGGKHKICDSREKWRGSPESVNAQGIGDGGKKGKGGTGDRLHEVSEEEKRGSNEAGRNLPRRVQEEEKTLRRKKRQ